MTNNFSFTQKVANCGFNPPQDRDKTIQKEIANDQSQETHFFNMGCDGNGFKTYDLKQEKSGKNEPKKGPSENENQKGIFWTICPYCYYMYEYEKKYEECCLLCQNCRKGFHGVAVEAPPERFLVNGEGEYYSGYGFFPLGYYGNSFLGDKKEVGGGDTRKKHDVVEISDNSDDEKKEMDVKNEAGKVKAEGWSNGQGRGVMKRVKSVPRNSKKMMGRGVKDPIEKVRVVEMSVEFENGVADIDCGSGGGIRLGSGSDQNGGCNEVELEFFEGDVGSGGGIRLGSGSDQNGGCNEDELEFFEGDDDIFVGLRDIC